MSRSGGRPASASSAAEPASPPTASAAARDRCGGRRRALRLGRRGGRSEPALLVVGGSLGDGVLLGLLELLERRGIRRCGRLRSGLRGGRRDRSGGATPAEGRRRLLDRRGFSAPPGRRRGWRRSAGVAASAGADLLRTSGADSRTASNPATSRPAHRTSMPNMTPNGRREGDCARIFRRIRAERSAGVGRTSRAAKRGERAPRTRRRRRGSRRRTSDDPRTRPFRRPGPRRRGGARGTRRTRPDDFGRSWPASGEQRARGFP